MARAAESIEIRRTSLLERLERVGPKIVACVAPAGFGKTTLVRQYLAGRGVGVVLDCEGVRDDLDLARRLIPALGLESPEREPTLTRRELMLGDGSTTVAERVQIALEAWEEVSGGTIVFENAEHIAASQAAHELFVRILAHRPPERTVAICSRENLRLHLTRYAPPHEIMVLRAHDLVFDATDVRMIFAQYLRDDASIDRIVAISQGWPIAVLLLKRLAAEGRFNDVLDRLHDVTFEELHDYLADEVLASLDPAMTRTIFTCACVGHTLPSDLRAVSSRPNVVEELAEFAKESPFITRNGDGSFVVHPLLASLVLEHQEERRAELLHDIASAHEARADFPRAAELYLAYGDQHAAARALGQHEVLRERSPSMQYAKTLAALDHVLVSRYPRLWGVRALLRMFCVPAAQLLDEAESMWRTLPPDSGNVERFYIFVFRVILMSYLGMFDQGLAMIDEFARATRADDPPRNLLDGHLLYLRGLLRARTGQFDDAERDLRVSLPFVEEMDVVAAGTFVTLGADIARARGERPVERHFIERAIERAEASGLTNFAACNYAEGLVGAWLAGESALAAEYAAKLDDTVERFGVRGFAYLAGTARGRAVEPTESDMPKYVAFGRLIALGNATENRERSRLAQAAHKAAQQTRQPFVGALSALALGRLDQAARADAFDIAQRLALQCDSQPFIDAVDAVVNERADAGMLESFIAHLERERLSFVPPITIDVFTGRVIVDGGVVQLSGRELELLVALALRREATPRTRLAAMLWPDLEEASARNSLSVCLHRLRAHLGRADAIVRDGDGYALHPHAIVDVWEIDRVIASVRSRESLSDAHRATLLRVWKGLAEPIPDQMERWEWFEPTARRLGDLRIEVAKRLAHDALERVDTRAALQFAAAVTVSDPCDEGGHEIAIRAHLLGGDRAAAMRQFRHYRETLFAELQVEPSPAIAALVTQ